MPEAINAIAGDSPTINLRRLPGVDSYEVLAVDLERLDELMSEENRAIGFASFCLSAALSAFLTWLTLDKKTASPAQLGVSCSVAIFGAVVGVYFTVAWWNARKKRPTILQRIMSKPIQPPARSE